MRPGPTSKPGQPRRDGVVRGGCGTRGVNRPAANAEDRKDGTGALTTGVVVVLLTTEHERAETRGDDGDPVAKQTVGINEGNGTDSPIDERA